MAASGLSWFKTREALLTMRSSPLSPAAVQPQPLLRIFANPALDHRGDGLHGALDVDLAGGVAHRRYLIGKFGAKAVTGQADDAHAMNRALDLPQQPRYRIAASNPCATAASAGNS